MSRTSSSEPGPVPSALPATVLTDRAWLADDLVRAQRLYGSAGSRVLATIRWYSASSVLVGPVLEPWVHSGTARDPALDAVTFDMHPDGRYLDARAHRPFDGDPAVLGTALAGAIDPVVSAIAEVSGASARALWAVAIDSIGNRLLWAGSATGSPDHAKRSARELGDHIAVALAEAADPSVRAVPRPRFEAVGPRPVLRRCSCCLIFQAPATAGSKCVSCPRQTPAERFQRLRTLLG